MNYYFQEKIKEVGLRSVILIGIALARREGLRWGGVFEISDFNTFCRPHQREVALGRGLTLWLEPRIGFRLLRSTDVSVILAYLYLPRENGQE